MNDLERYLTALWQAGDVREVRAPQWKGTQTASGYFDDPAKLAAAVAEWDGKANLYLTINPVAPALLARAANRIKNYAKSTTADVDILERRWIYIDIDPRRQSGISASDVESAAALTSARDVTAYLTGLGWPIPLVAMTGNGYALIVRIDLPNDESTNQLVGNVLAHLADRFDTDAVSIDPTVANAARIVALIGTMKIKGDSTPERPHRRATLVWVPESFIPVSRGQLEALAPPPVLEWIRPGGSHQSQHGWVKQALERAQISFKERERGGKTWYGLESCPYHPDDGIPWQCGVAEDPDGKAAGHCFHSRGFGKGWQDFKRDLGLESPPAISVAFAEKPHTNGTAPLGMDAADLLAMDLPELRWIVPGLIPEGTTILAAPPKVGKSCLVYQMAVEATIGGELLGRRVEPGSVLHLALEDGQRRGKERLRAALAGRTMPRGRLEIRWSAPRIGAGLEDEILAWLDRTPDALFVAIDTLGKVRPQSDGRRNAYDVDVSDLARLQDLFRNRPVGLVIVHHLRKERGGDDFLTAVSGTYGITGSADTTAVLKRKRHEAFGTLEVTGRDIPEAEISVRFDGMTWQEAPEAMVGMRQERKEVLDIIVEQGPIFPAAIAREQGKKGKNDRQSVAYLVERLVEDGLVVRVDGGFAANQVQILSSTLPFSTVSERKGSKAGHIARAHVPPAREGQLRVVPDTTAWIPGRECHQYAGHQSSHRQTSEGWTCDVCYPAVTA